MALRMLPVKVTEITFALEREAQTEDDVQWVAAQRLRQMIGWDKRTLVCAVETDPASETVAAG